MADYKNMSRSQLIHAAIFNNEGVLSNDGALIVNTGQHTGRSPNDRYFVRDEHTETHIDWGKTNHGISQAIFERLKIQVEEYLKSRQTFEFRGYAATHPIYRLPVSVLSQTAWHTLFCTNMFIDQPWDTPDSATIGPPLRIFHAPDLRLNNKLPELNSSTFVIINLTQREIIIAGTAYAGEIKKAVFTALNYWMPEKGILPMHCSVNTSEQDSAVFFGLSGTGKTTLSATPDRILIGDDEHGWCDDGVFNFEGGCYAKLINLQEQDEPEIFHASHRFGATMENVVVDQGGAIDLCDSRFTENTRASYPIEFITNASSTGRAKQPAHIIMLTCDAFGVLPPVSRLSHEQAMYHFLLGYTAKIAGTEQGITTPEATFSACFGAPFMPLNPTKYAALLGEKLKTTQASCWLINTGWIGGEYGTGHRVPIKISRSIVNAILTDQLNHNEYIKEPHFGLHTPLRCSNIDSTLLNPSNMWQDSSKYEAQALMLAKKFALNFKKYEALVSAEVRNIAIHPCDN